nr:haloacid dehalogenase [arsenite-oxidising bacterium NT-25]CAD6606542.1 haloacid dehalogenase [Rhizobium sp. TCK]
MSSIQALMIDVDCVLVCGRPSDGRPWASTVEDDLGLPVADLQREFFSPYWDEIVLCRAALVDHLKPVLAKIAPHLSCGTQARSFKEGGNGCLEDVTAVAVPRRAPGVEGNRCPDRGAQKQRADGPHFVEPARSDVYRKPHQDQERRDEQGE